MELPLTTSSPREADGCVTLGELALHKLDRLLTGLHATPEVGELARRVLGAMGESWAGRRRTSVAPWASDITDDHSPFELSVGIDGARREIRLLTEVQTEPMHGPSAWASACALHEKLAFVPGFHAGALSLVGDLFGPHPNVPVRFALWHAAAIVGSEVLIKAYLNPQVLGAAAAPRLTRAALERLGLGAAWADVKALLAAGDGRNELCYVALDLSTSDQARVKVYIAHPGADAAGLAHQLSRFERCPPGFVEPLVRTLTETHGKLTARPILSCLSFQAGSGSPAVTLHVPVRAYVPNDAIALDRLRRWVGPSKSAELCAGIERYVERPLAEGRGAITYVSARPSSEGDPRVVVYLSPEAYAVGAPLATAAPGAGSAERSTLAEALDQALTRRAALERHAVISLIDNGLSRSELTAIGGAIAFFVLTFQDVLRVVAREVKTPLLAELAAIHLRGDAGHERWLLHDLRLLGAEPALTSLFSASELRAREAGYEVVAEVLRGRNDCTRIAALLALECSSDAFFRRVVPQAERLVPEGGLLFFGQRHLDAEADHGVCEERTLEILRSVQVTRETLAATAATIERVFRAIELMADHTLERIMAARWRAGGGPSSTSPFSRSPGEGELA